MTACPAIFPCLSLTNERNVLKNLKSRQCFHQIFIQAIQRRFSPVTDNLLKLSTDENTNKKCLLFHYTGHLWSSGTFLGFSHSQTCRLQSQFYAPSSRIPVAAVLLHYRPHQIWESEPGSDLCWAEWWHHGEIHPSNKDSKSFVNSAAFLHDNLWYWYCSYWLILSTYIFPMHKWISKVIKVCTQLPSLQTPTWTADTSHYSASSLLFITQ